MTTSHSIIESALHSTRNQNVIAFTAIAEVDIRNTVIAFSPQENKFKRIDLLLNSVRNRNQIRSVLKMIILQIMSAKAVNFRVRVGLMHVIIFTPIRIGLGVKVINDFIAAETQVWPSFESHRSVAPADITLAGVSEAILKTSTG